MTIIKSFETKHEVSCSDKVQQFLSGVTGEPADVAIETFIGQGLFQNASPEGMQKVLNLLEEVL